MKNLISLLLLIVLSSSAAFSCMCGRRWQKNMREQAQWYASRPGIDLVFEGKVTEQQVKNGSVGAPSGAMSITFTGRFRVVQFSIARVFRGPETQAVTVLSGYGTSDCGVRFETGETYLVYASRLPNGSWFTSTCDGTEETLNAGPALRFLDGEAPTPDDLLSPSEYISQYQKNVLPNRTGSVCGVVLTPDDKPLQHASVHLSEIRQDDLPPRTGEDPNTSNADGHFCIERVTPAHYILTVEGSYEQGGRIMAYYPGVPSRADALAVDILPGVRLPDVKLITFHEPLFAVRVRVVTPIPTQLSRPQTCGVNLDSADRDALSYHMHHALDDDDTFIFGDVPAGKYRVSTYFQPDYQQDKPSPDADRWKPVDRELVVQGYTDLVIQMNLAR